jgi:hypothetical protein
MCHLWKLRFIELSKVVFFLRSEISGTLAAEEAGVLLNSRKEEGRKVRGTNYWHHRYLLWNLWNGYVSAGLCGRRRLDSNQRYQGLLGAET